MQKLASPLAFYRTAYSLAQETRPTWSEQLYQLDIPRLFMFGDVSLREKTVRIEDVEELPLHGVQVTVLPDARHLMMWDNTPGFIRAIAAFEAR